MQRGPRGKEGTGWGPQAISLTDDMILQERSRAFPEPNLKETRVTWELNAQPWRPAEGVWLDGGGGGGSRAGSQPGTQRQADPRPTSWLTLISILKSEGVTQMLGDELH